MMIKGINSFLIQPSVYRLINSVIHHKNIYMGGGVVRGDKLPQLITLINKNPRFEKSKNNEIISLIDQIAFENENLVKKDQYREKVNGNWKLLWTTEKETLFFIANGLLGSKTEEIIQTIDIENRILQNRIYFENNKEFNVNGVIEEDNLRYQRINFKFSSASVKLGWIIPEIKIPPLGKGWFDTLYINNRYRISKDVRNDYIVCERI